jgi:4-diphosphocytidyl-2-C-methyl-D-erythritol kinase
MRAGGVLALTAPAKVNLALHVTGRRPDGYHLLDSIAVFTELGDRVEIAGADGLRLDISGPFAAHAPDDRTNLAWRAAEAFYRLAGLAPAAAIRIEKHIPAGAGLGGGSADAAAVLIGLRRLHGTGPSGDDLARTALALGADVPMCLAGQALRARGIGERLELLRDWPALPLVLVWPGAPVSTAACFAALSCRDNLPLDQPAALRDAKEAAAWLAGARNDLQDPASRLEPAVGEAIAALEETRDCLLARMSGSGSACFGLYVSRRAADQAAQSLKVRQPGWWVAATSAG